MNITDYSYTNISLLAEFLLSGLPVHLRIHARDHLHERRDNDDGTVECLLTMDHYVVAIFQLLEDRRQGEIELHLELAVRRTRVDGHLYQTTIRPVMETVWPVRAVHGHRRVDVLLVELL